VAPDPEFTVRDDPELKISSPDWARDHNLRSAFKFSVVWYYQEMARRAGADRMAQLVHQFGYGSKDTSGGVDKFWLGSTCVSRPTSGCNSLSACTKGAWVSRTAPHAR
jgi:beta-lactamase class D